MTIESFIAMTLRLIARDGFNGYLPTLALPARQSVFVLEGMPATIGAEDAARRWCEEKVDGAEDFFLAFKLGEEQFKVIARSSGCMEERVVRIG